MIKRLLYDTLVQRMDNKKAIVVMGPRQVGKTTLIKQIANAADPNYLYVNGDDPAMQLLWSKPTQQLLTQLIAGQKLIVIDEAQRFTNIGITAKMIVEAGLDVQLFLSGSFALEMADTINEPLTGRKWEYNLLPFSWQELCNEYGLAKMLPRLPQLLVTGCYPDVIMQPTDAREILSNLAGSYLYKDILEISSIRKPNLIIKLLQALAWQVGHEVSMNELSNTLGADKNTIAHYIDLLEKSFVIFRLNPLARNLRNEISTSRKIYFYDNGILNTLINNYAPIEARNDIGSLWENFMISERFKALKYGTFYGATFFWRNKAKAEIDYVEETDGQFYAYDFKWNPKAKSKFPEAFINGYNPTIKRVIHRENFWEWLV
jgi:predicted AAA+ superfamily ATPase